MKTKKSSPSTYFREVLYEALPVSKKKKKKKVSSEEFIVPTFSEWENLTTINYNVSQLKSMCRYYKQKRSGNKPDLIKRLYNFLKFSYYSTMIQKRWRAVMVRNYNKLHGPATFSRKCTNNTDFLSLNPIDELSYNQFFSFEDKDGFIYGFDARSFHNLLEKNKNPTNPYNRQPITDRTIFDFKKFLRVGKMLGQNIVVNITSSTGSLSLQKRLELKAISIFQKIDEFGHITDSNWFTNLNKQQVIKLLRELLDIWSYRASLTDITKRSICPPNGDPFVGVNLSISHLGNLNLTALKMIALNIFDNLLSKSPDPQQRAIGAYYILGAVTLVSQLAANALPWLYESVYYFGDNNSGQQ